MEHLSNQSSNETRYKCLLVILAEMKRIDVFRTVTNFNIKEHVATVDADTKFSRENPILDIEFEMRKGNWTGLMYTAGYHKVIASLNEILSPEILAELNLNRAVYITNHRASFKVW